MCNTFHHGLENAVLYLFRLIQFLYFSKEVVIQLSGFLPTSGTMKVRLIAFLG